MGDQEYKVYGYRWVILAVFMFINLTIQILWICFAPITGPAAQYYGVSDLQIGFLAMLFMIVYIPLSLPVSWMIDTLGYRKSVSIGAALLGVFGVLRGFFAADYFMVVVSTIGLAIAQPFLLNAISTVAARWFPIQERATASGLAMVAGFIGIAIGQVTSPLLVLRFGIPQMQLLFGMIAAVSAVVFLLFTRDAPPTPPCPVGQESRALMLTGLKSMLRMREIWFLLVIFLVGMGIFNGVSTWIEEIVRPKGFTISQAGELGGILLIGGIVGAIIFPALSDKLRKRKLFLLLGMILAIPGLAGIILAQSYLVMLVSMFTLGFFLMSLAPIGYQYGAEITFPAPEGTSNGLLNLAGQISVVFVYAMDAFKNADGTFTTSLVVLVGLMVVNAFLIANLRESQLIDAQPA
ncbi:MAG: MFS transporter [Anaerolineaceae bacterium]|nr:MFS transporter [Anaerolineaceae bacterium]